MSEHSARRIDGRALSEQVRNEVAQGVQNLDITPGLAVVIVGDDPASHIYVRNKAKACEQVGMHSQVIRLPADISQDELLSQIQALNEADEIHGILVQLPLPDHLDENAVIATIDPAKDVDGFHVINAGHLLIGNPQIKPCTPYGIMRMLENEGVSAWGAEAVVVGASNIVGKPIALLLQAAGATVTICNSKTRDLAAHTRRADILVTAVGRPEMITGDMIKPGAVIIDVGINRLDDGRLVGDVDFDDCQPVAQAITPVPGGVGPMTIAMLLVNTLEAAQKHAQRATAPNPNTHA